MLTFYPASDIVMTQPGLSVMVDAIRQSRKIFERMKDYSTYTMSVTVRIVFTFSILTFAYDWYFATVLVLIIAILNDGTIMTISRFASTLPHPSFAVFYSTHFIESCPFPLHDSLLSSRNLLILSQRSRKTSPLTR